MSLDQGLGLLLVEEGDAAEDHLGVGDRIAVLARDRGDDDEEPVGGERAAVAQGDVVGIADVDAVDEDHAGADVGAERGPVGSR